MGSNREDARALPSSDRLRAKLGLIGDMDVEMDMEALQRAEEAVAQLQESYSEWVGPDIQRMGALLKEAKALSGDAQAGLMEAIFDLAHNIKGQGLSFNYPLMTRIGESLCEFLRTQKKMDAAAFCLIEAHIQAMAVVIRDRIQDEEAPLAEKVVAELSALGGRLG